MLGTILTLSWLVCGQISSSDMAELVSERLNRLDRVVLGMDATTWLLPSECDSEDQACWYYFDGATPIVHKHRLTVVRPGILDEWLTDLPERGFVPVEVSLSDGRVVAKHVRPSDRGWTNYEIVEGTGHASLFSWSPILQVIDIQIMDSQIPQWNMRRIFQECDVTFVRSNDGINEYRASRDMGSFRQDYEFSLDDRGTPLRFKTIQTYDDSSLHPATWEQRVVNTVDLDGVALPCETLVTIDNPNLNLPYKTLHHFVVTSIEQNTELSCENVRIEPSLRNSSIATYYADGTKVRHIRDANGNVVQTDEVIGAMGPDLDSDWHLSDLWTHGGMKSQTVPAVVAMLSLCAFALTLGLFRRKSSARRCRNDSSLFES